MKGDVREKIFGGLFGCAVGDALGVTFEGMDGDENRIPAMSGGGQFNLRKGDVSDDTLMMLALGETYCETGE
ncbi:MAG: ADP-ribosylglycohydrolase family protein, partial [Methanocorpusculum sp.]|nr:ADP-ribosylglycohydrolase family protein [Methanocorpusculum sp.]MDD4133024.1 ADP-ribosylglycohydrolase family protein [Methanocorpusculum sp.]